MFNRMQALPVAKTDVWHYIKINALVKNSLKFQSYP